MAEVHTPKSRAISASEIPYSRLKLQAILDRTRETLLACPPILSSPSPEELLALVPYNKKAHPSYWKRLLNGFSSAGPLLCAVRRGNLGHGQAIEAGFNRPDNPPLPG